MPEPKVVRVCVAEGVNNKCRRPSCSWNRAGWLNYSNRSWHWVCGPGRATVERHWAESDNIADRREEHSDQVISVNPRKLGKWDRVEMFCSVKCPAEIRRHEIVQSWIIGTTRYGSLKLDAHCRSFRRLDSQSNSPIDICRF